MRRLMSAVYLAALRRLAEAPTRFPAPRADADLMHNRENSKSSRRGKQDLEQHPRDIDLPCACADSLRCLL